MRNRISHGTALLTGFAASDGNGDQFGGTFAITHNGLGKFLRDGTPYGLGPSRSRFGFLCVEGMAAPTGAEAVDPDTGEVVPATIAVLPTHYKSPQTGVLLEVENPQVWVYPEGEEP